MSTQKEAVRQQVRLLKSQAKEEVEANQAGMTYDVAFDSPKFHVNYRGLSGFC